MAVGQLTEAGVGEIIDRWDARPDCLIEMLHDVQSTESYLPKWALVEIGRRTGVPASQIYSVATFYNAFSLRPRGRHCVGVCIGTPCHVQGAPHVLGALERELGIKSGQTDEGLNFTLMTSGCVGTCGLAPVVIIDDEMYGKVTQAQVRRILKRYREEQAAQAAR